MPKFAVMTFMFEPWWRTGRMTHEAMLAGFAAAGVEGVEPFDRDFVEDPNLLRRYNQCLADHNMRVPAVDVMCNLVYANDRQRQQARDDLREGLDICKELASEIAHVAGHRLPDGVTPADGRKMIAEGLADAAGIAGEYGLVLAIENFLPSPDLVCSAQDCLEILRLTGHVAEFVFDTGNFVAVDERADEVFHLVADHICHCHFKDFTIPSVQGRGWQACDLGEGAIPNAAVARKLAARGYDGWVALETRKREQIDPVAAVAKELPRLKSWFSGESVDGADA